MDFEEPPLLENFLVPALLDNKHHPFKLEPLILVREISSGTAVVCTELLSLHF